MKAPRFLALLPAALAIAGCITVGPDYKLPQEAAINAPLANAPLDVMCEFHERLVYGGVQSVA